MQESFDLGKINDYKRAYIGSKLSWSQDTTDFKKETGAHFGWDAFIVGRVSEAIEATKEYLKSSSDEKKSAELNLGLFFLFKALQEKTSEQESLSLADNFYELIFNWIAEKADRDIEKNYDHVIAMAIEDLTQFKNQLHPDYVIYLGKFMELSKKQIPAKP